MKKDNLDHQISKLPKQYMGETQKKKNWTQIQSKLREPRRKHWLAYPITAVVFGLFIFILLLNFGERGMVNAPEKENEMTEYVTVFEGHEPFVDISIISNALPPKHELSTAAGYIFQAARLFKNEHPIKNNTPVDSLIKEYSTNEKQLADDSFGTFAYLKKASDLLEGRTEATELNKKIKNWVDELETMHQADSFASYQDRYLSIKKTLIYLARAIQDITPESTILKGEGERWEITLQRIDSERYLLSIFFKDITNIEEFDGVGKTEIMLSDSNQEIFSQNRYIGSGGTYTDFRVPIVLEDVEDLEMTINWGDGEEDSITLNKEVY